MDKDSPSHSTQLDDFLGEIWVDVTGWDGIYQVSNLGRVKSLFRHDTLGRRVREKIIKQQFWIDKKRKNAIRHVKIFMHNCGIKEYRYLSIIVWEAFNGDREGKEVLHMDGDVINNNLINLKLGTRSDRFIKDYINKKRPLHISKFSANLRGKKRITNPTTKKINYK